MFTDDDHQLGAMSVWLGSSGSVCRASCRATVAVLSHVPLYGSAPFWTYPGWGGSRPKLVKLAVVLLRLL